MALKAHFKLRDAVDTFKLYRCH